MNPKRRKRAVFLSTLMVVACLTALPTASDAYIVKWGWWYPPLLGEPDLPTGTGLIRIKGFQISLLRLGTGTWVLSVQHVRSVG